MSPHDVGPIAPDPAAAEDPARQGPARLDSRRLWMGLALTPMLSGFYPAIFLAEPSIMPLGLLLAYASSIVVGVPLVVWLDRRFWRSWWQFAAVGAVCALPSIVLYAFTTPPAHLAPFGILPALGLLLWGGASGLVFWLIGITGETPVSLRSLFDPLVTKH